MCVFIIYILTTVQIYTLSHNIASKKDLQKTYNLYILRYATRYKCKKSSLQMQRTPEPDEMRERILLLVLSLVAHFLAILHSKPKGDDECVGYDYSNGLLGR